jgi:CheY-like chemotaxis protein
MRCPILCVDDDLGILEAYRRLLGRRYEVYLARGPLQGLAKLEGGPDFAVVLTDMRMPEMDGVEFLRRVRECRPRARRIVLSGDAERETAVRAINEGRVDAFLTKPCPSQRLAEAVEEACRQWCAETPAEQKMEPVAGRELLKGMLAVLRAADPALYDRSLRIRDLVRALCEAGGQELDAPTETACLLSQIGLLYQDKAIRAKIEAGQPLSPGEERECDRTASALAEMVECLPALAQSATILRWHRASFDPDQPRGAPVGSGLPEGSRLLRLAADADWFAGAGGFAQVQARLRARACSYDPELLRRLDRIGLSALGERARRSPKPTEAC